MTVDASTGAVTAATGTVPGTYGGPLWWVRTRPLIVFAAVAAGVLTSRPYPDWPGALGVIVLLLAACAVGRIPVVWHRTGLVRDLGLVLTAVAGTALTMLLPNSAAVAFVAFAVVDAAQRWSSTAWAGLALGLTCAYVVGQSVLDRSTTVILIGPAVIAGSVLIGLVRRQNATIAAEAQYIREEKARSAALDERARIAREIHDVLAHALAALVVQLETADALLESGRPDQARGSVLRASQLAKEGMAETRRAIGALRGDTLPLPVLLEALASAYRMDLGVSATVRVAGEPRDLPPDVGLTLYRTAQEAVTNVRKHAPASTVTIELTYRPAEVALDVRNGAAPGTDAPLAATGGGYGLTGLRERAELAGGHIDAGPSGDGWRIDVRIPA